MRIRAKGTENHSPADWLITGGWLNQVHPADISQKFNCGGENVFLAAGFIDLQINGYGGIDFNDAGTTTEQITAVTRALWRTGVTAYCPTVITESPDHISRCLTNLIRAADESPEFALAFTGIHLEGPFISPEDGPRGAHPRQHVRPPDWEQFERWQDTARGQIRILTLSPEWPESVDFIERASATGVIVAIGHTAANPARIADAVRAGAKMSTHLGNGSHAKIDRHPNYIWEQLANDELWASFIVDGHHLPPSVVKCFLRGKGIARSILVTDAIAAAGCAPGKYKLGNVEVEVTEAGRVCLPGTPYLAGSALEMHDAIGKTVAYSAAALEDVLRMASANPAKLLGLDGKFGTIEVGRRADLVLFEWDEQAMALSVVATIVNGEIVYRRNNDE